MGAEDHDLPPAIRRLFARRDRRLGMASGDVPSAQDVRSPEKRCFTYCGDDKCDCLANPSPLARAFNSLSNEELAELMRQRLARASTYPGGEGER